MTKTALLLIENDRWRLYTQPPNRGGDAPAHSGATEESSPPAIFEGATDERSNELTQSLARFSVVVIAVASDTVLAAGFHPPAMSRLTPTALLYEFERFLPVPAEQVVADFFSHDAYVLGVAAQFDQLTPAVDAIREANCRVAAICPLVFLALKQVEIDQDAVLVWPRADQIDVIHNRGGLPKNWLHAPATESDLDLALAQIETPESSEHNIVYLGPNPPAGRDVRHLPSPDQIVAAWQEAQQIGRGTRRAPIDLCRGSLAAGGRISAVGQAGKAAVAALIILLAVTMIALVWRAQRYEAETESHLRAQRQSFAQVFPGQPTPISVSSRLRSERDRLLSRSHTESGRDDSHLLKLLVGSLAALPEDLRIRILRLRADRNALDLDGQTVSFAAAGDIAEAVDQHPWIEAAQPSTEQLSGGGVSFLLRVNWNPTPSPDGNQP